MSRPVALFQQGNATVIPVAINDAMETGAAALAAERFPGILHLFNREVKYRRLAIGKPRYVTRGVINDKTREVYRHWYAGSPPVAPDMILFPYKQYAGERGYIGPIADGFRAMTDQWFWIPDHQKVLVPASFDDIPARFVKPVFDDILGDDPRFVWIGDYYE